MSTETQKVDVQRRIAEIDADLIAYRNGWWQYDSAHVASLKNERDALARVGGAA